MKLRSLLPLILVHFGATAAFAAVIPPERLVAWQGNVGIPGGIPDRTTIYQTIAAGASMSSIQTALNSCPSNQVVRLQPGVYTISGTLTIPSWVTLRGSGMSNTVLNTTGSSTSAIKFGTAVSGEYTGTVRNMNSGYTKGSTSVVLSSTSGLAPGQLMVIDQLNDASLPVTIEGQYGSCTWASRDNGRRALGQIVEVTAVNGSTVSFQPPLFWTYSGSLSPQAVTFSVGCQWAGLEDLSVKQNNSGYTTVELMEGAKYCWLKGVENDFADGDHAQLGWTYRCEVRQCYFHDGFDHNSGNTDNDLMLHAKTTGCLVEDNIFYRQHVSVMVNSGASGNVIAYNFSADPYDDLAVNVHMNDVVLNHRPHPMFNLIEGNVVSQIRPDRAWGSSSHGTIFRNYVTCSSFIRPPYSARGALGTGHWASQALRGISVDAVNEYYSIVGNLLRPQHTPSAGVTYLAVHPANLSYQDRLYLLSFGYSDIGGSSLPDSRCYENAIIHGNYDSVSNGQRWDPSIPDTNLPNSYYLGGKPQWFGNLSWPPFDPARPVTAQATNIPAGYRFVFGSNPPGSGAAAPAPPSGLRVVSSP